RDPPSVPGLQSQEKPKLVVPALRSALHQRADGGNVDHAVCRQQPALEHREGRFPALLAARRQPPQGVVEEVLGKGLESHEPHEAAHGRIGLSATAAPADLPTPASSRTWLGWLPRGCCSGRTFSRLEPGRRRSPREDYVVFER